MTTASEFESRVAAGHALTRADIDRVMAWPNLVDVGALGEAARKARSGDEVTYGRVCGVEHTLDDPGEAGEIRIVGTPASTEVARQWVRAAASRSRGVPLTGFSLADLLRLAGGDHLALSEIAAVLRQEGLEAVADVPLDALGDTENVVEVVRAVQHGGLGAWRATVGAAVGVGARLDLIERAVEVQRETGALRALAPLPRLDPATAPATGFDDVRTVAAARLMAASIPVIQVDWPLYGPKLAQVAIAYGAGDIDGISPIDTLQLGPRRSPVEDIERQIRSAFAVPVRRNGRYERAS